jgi:hypothetical protein
MVVDRGISANNEFGLGLQRNLAERSRWLPTNGFCDCGVRCRAEMSGMRPRPGEVLHFSEDAGITEFVPRRAPTQDVDSVHVWAVDGFHAPSYWFPRACPRALAWRLESTTEEDASRLLGPGRGHVHVIDYRWLERMREAVLYVYRFDGSLFRPLAVHGSALVCDHPVRPLGPPEVVSDVLSLHADAGIELRVTTDPWP